MENNTNLIVERVPYTMSNKELESVFSKIGLVQSCVIMKDKCSGLSKGYGFVKYFTPMDAARAMELLNGLSVQHMQLKISYARTQEVNNRPVTLFVYNIAPSVGPQDLFTLFCQYGNVHTVYIFRKGVYAFVTMYNRHQAITAVQALNFVPFHNRVLQVRVKEFKNFIKE